MNAELKSKSLSKPKLKKANLWGQEAWVCESHRSSTIYFKRYGSTPVEAYFEWLSATIIHKRLLNLV
jgi:hypothetical protein